MVMSSSYASGKQKSQIVVGINTDIRVDVSRLPYFFDWLDNRLLLLTTTTEAFVSTENDSDGTRTSINTDWLRQNGHNHMCILFIYFSK